MIAKSYLCPVSYRGKAEERLNSHSVWPGIGFKAYAEFTRCKFINGKPTVYGDTLLAVCSSAQDFEYCREEFDEINQMATCSAKRRNRPERHYGFTKADAEKAGLWGKQGAWRTHPKRMLQMKARNFCLRDEFADILCGFAAYEDLIEVQEEKDVTPIPQQIVIDYKSKFKEIANERNEESSKHFKY